MIASTNLGSDIRANIRQMMTVASNKALNGGNLVVYYSESKSRSYLFQIKEDKKGNIVTDTVRFYENQSAILPETMQRYSRKQQTCFQQKVMVWYYPAMAHRGCQVISVLYVLSEENGQYMEITEMNEALEGFHFDFMLFDACYMSGIECAYELKDKTDYLLGSPTEVLARGFPYEDFLPALFKDKADLEAVTKVFMNTTAITIMLHTAQYL